MQSCPLGYFMQFDLKPHQQIILCYFSLEAVVLPNLYIMLCSVQQRKTAIENTSKQLTMRYNSRIKHNKECM